MDFVCAECGDDEAPTYVVTVLDREDPKHTRTEVCLPCFRIIDQGES